MSGRNGAVQQVPECQLSQCINDEGLLKIRDVSVRNEPSPAIANPNSSCPVMQNRAGWRTAAGSTISSRDKNRRIRDTKPRVSLTLLCWNSCGAEKSEEKPQLLFIRKCEPRTYGSLIFLLLMFPLSNPRQGDKVFQS